MDFQQMLASLHETLGSKIHISDENGVRLNRTLRHYVKEVNKSGGSDNDVLRETYDSFVKWFRRTNQKPVVPTRMTPLHMASFDNMVDYTTGVTMPAMDDDESPLDKFERIKNRRMKLEELTLPQTMSTIPQEFSQAKDQLQRQENTVKYREAEYNLILNSKDRDWVNSTKENRYNFSILLDSAARPQGTSSQATITNRFRNITKIEFIKIILPVEGLDVVIQRDTSGTSITNSGFLSALSIPFITVTMDEINGNNYGTSEQIDKSLAVCQYDATWRSESMTTNKTNSRGYTLFFPKFMKAQRIYAPTPLASLQKMSFTIQNPENQLLSMIPDAVSVQNFYYGNCADLSANTYTDISSDYIFIESPTYFPLWSFNLMDRIQFAGITTRIPNDMVKLIPTGTESKKHHDLIDWLQKAEGHVVIGTAYRDSVTRRLLLDSNESGYCNYIIIRNRFNDPSSGLTRRKVFMEESVTTVPIPVAGSILNVSRQVQLSLRVTVRELDSTTNLRPDNI